MNWRQYKTLEHLSKDELCEALALAIDLTVLGEGVSPSHWWVKEMRNDYPGRALETLQIFEHIVKRGLP